MAKYSSFSLSLLAIAVAITALEAAIGVHAVPKYAVVNRAGGTPGGARFHKEIGAEYARSAMASASDFILNTTFEQTSEADRKNVTAVTLYVDNPKKGRHHHHRASLRVSGEKIHVSGDFIRGIKDADVRRAFTGVIYHVMTHVWQWKGNKEAPKWLTEGIADYVRLKAGYAPAGWARPGGGDRRDEGRGVAARFLDYCGDLKKGFVAELNKRMRTGYSDGFFVDILGKTVDQLWADYKAKYANN